MNSSAHVFSQSELQQERGKANRSYDHQSQWAGKRWPTRIQDDQGEREQEEAGGNDAPAARFRLGFRVGIVLGQGFPSQVIQRGCQGFQIATSSNGVPFQLPPPRMASGPDEPFGAARISIIDGVKNEFDAGGDPQLVEDAEYIFLDGVFAQVQFRRDLAVPQAFGD